MSYFEIYKDDCYDLLVPREKVSGGDPRLWYFALADKIIQAPKLPVREDASGQVVVAGLEKVPIASSADFADTYTCV